MIEVASWKIVWAVLGAMLTALSFSKIYQIEGNYITLMAMNFIIAVAMLMTPKIVSSIVGHGFHSEATSLGVVATAAAVAAPARVMMIKALGSEAVRDTASFTKGTINKFKGSK